MFIIIFNYNCRSIPVWTDSWSRTTVLPQQRYSIPRFPTGASPRHFRFQLTSGTQRDESHSAPHMATKHSSVSVTTPFPIGDYSSALSNRVVDRWPWGSSRRREETSATTPQMVADVGETLSPCRTRRFCWTPARCRICAFRFRCRIVCRRTAISTGTCSCGRPARNRVWTDDLLWRGRMRVGGWILIGGISTPCQSRSWRHRCHRPMEWCHGGGRIPEDFHRTGSKSSPYPCRLCPARQRCWRGFPSDGNRVWVWIWWDCKRFSRWSEIYWMELGGSCYIEVLWSENGYYSRDWSRMGSHGSNAGIDSIRCSFVRRSWWRGTLNQLAIELSRLLW